MLEKSHSKVNAGKPEWKNKLPDITKHEYVGLIIRVEWSTNPDVVGITGHVIDETRNTLTIKTNKNKTKVLSKEENKFIFTLPDGERVLVEGKRLIGRPEDRIKKKHKKW